MSTAIPTRTMWGIFRRSLLWLLFLGPFFFLSYGYANHLAASRGITASIHFGWERQIPFLPWTIVPYWSIDLLYGFSFLCSRSVPEVDRHALRLLSAQLISVACFLLFPLRFGSDRPHVDGLFGTLFNVLDSFDLPYNQAPSLHIALLVLIWYQFAKLKTGLPVRLFMHGWAILIGISVLTTWQHHFIDVPTGATVGLLCLWLWPDVDWPTPLKRTSGPGSGGLATIYALAGLTTFLAALAIGGTALWLSWPALSLVLVGYNYAWAGAGGFQKSGGRHSLAVRWLFAPYFFGAWLNARLWTRCHREPDAIADGIWLGHLPGSTGMRAGGFAALLDLTAELPTPSGAWRYTNLPWFDLVAPTPQQLIAAAERIEILRKEGRLLVACALGYARSAAAMIVWLRRYGGAPTLADAITMLHARRPQVVLNPTLLTALNDTEREIARPGR